MCSDPINEKPPKLAVLLLKYTTPCRFIDYLVGDLHEEFDERAGIDLKAAKTWFWKQAVNSAIKFFNVFLTSTRLLNIIVLSLTPILLCLFITTVTWISHTDHTAPAMMAYLVKGEVHHLTLNLSVLASGYEKLMSGFSVDVYLSISGFYWSLFSFAVLYLQDKKKSLSAHKIALWGYALMLAPYCLGLSYIKHIQPDPINIGAIVGFMVFPIIYMLIPLCLWITTVIRKTNDSPTGLSN